MRILPIEATTERIPGAAPVSDHSLFAALTEAHTLTLMETQDDDTTSVLKQVSHAQHVPLGGEWLRHAYTEDPDQRPVGRAFDDST